MAHSLDLNQLGIGGFALVAAIGGAAMYFGVGNVSMGSIGTGTKTYSTHITCGDTPKSEPSLVKSFFGNHGGKRVLVRGFTRKDARATLEATYPDCTYGVLSRQGRSKGWGL